MYVSTFKPFDTKDQAVAEAAKAGIAARHVYKLGKWGFDPAQVITDSGIHRIPAQAKSQTRR